MKKLSITKIVIIVCLFVVIIGVGTLIKREIEESKCAAVMALDNSNTIVTGIWDEDNLENYTCIAIPNSNQLVNSVNKGYYDEYSKVTTIGEAAFKENSYVEIVYIPENIKEIKKDAFAGCSSLKKVLYSGTKEQWEEIHIEQGNEVLEEVIFEYNADMPANNDF